MKSQSVASACACVLVTSSPVMDSGQATTGNELSQRPTVRTQMEISENVAHEDNDLKKPIMARLLEHSVLVPVSRGAALCLLLFLLWAVLVSETGVAAEPPRGQLFGLLLLLGVAEVAALVSGWVRLPPLMGSLLAGVLLKNVGAVNMDGEYAFIAQLVRKLSLAVILLRAGLGLDPGSLRRLASQVFRLAVLPSATEACTLAVASHFILGLPWLWGLLLGWGMAAVSPAVVIPCLFALQNMGYGTRKGVPTLVVAAASIDDIIAVSIFGIFINVIFSSGDLVMKILQGPIGVVIGLGFGILWGILLRFIPNQKDDHVGSLRTALLFAGGLMCVLGAEAVGFDGAGPLGSTVAGFVAAWGWRRQGWTSTNPVSENFRLIWAFCQPALFGLIGAEIDFAKLDSHHIALAIASLAIALTCRIAITVLVAFGGNFTWKEKLFLAFSWFPKATVQAALGPVALDMVRSMANPSADDLEYSNTVLQVAVLAIIFTAPLGAAFISLLGPKLLEHDDDILAPGAL